jgi:hypothetical protein
MRTINGFVAIAVLTLAPVLANAAPKPVQLQQTASQQSSVVQNQTAPARPLLPGSFDYQGSG